jgi:hypothetical protein
MIDFSGVKEWKVNGTDIKQAACNGVVVWARDDNNPYRKMDGFYIEHIEGTETITIFVTLPKRPWWSGYSEFVYEDADGVEHSVGNSSDNDVKERISLPPNHRIHIKSLPGYMTPSIQVRNDSTKWSARVSVYGNLSSTRSYRYTFYQFWGPTTDSYRRRESCTGRFEGLFAYSNAIKYAHNLYVDRNSGKNAYRRMFYGCNRLVTSPLLRTVTSAEDKTFEETYMSCSSLTNIKILAPDYDFSEIDNWGVPQSCVFYHNSIADMLPSNVILSPVNVRYSAAQAPEVSATMENHGGSHFGYQRFTMNNVYTASAVHCSSIGQYATITLTNTDSGEHILFSYTTYGYGGSDERWPIVFEGSYSTPLEFRVSSNYSYYDGRTYALTFYDLFDMNYGLEYLSFPTNDPQ